MKQDLGRYDPKRATREQARYVEQLAPSARDKPLTAEKLWLVDLLVQMKFRSIAYRSYVVELAGGQGTGLYWITRDHARVLGEILRGASLAQLHLALTTFEPGAADALVAALRDAPPTIDELTFNHKSGDEVTLDEARAFARFATLANVKTAHLWAAEFDAGAIDVLAGELASSTTLGTIDVCDTTRREPDDRIAIPVLDELVRVNRARAR